MQHRLAHILDVRGVHATAVEGPGAGSTIVLRFTDDEPVEAEAFREAAAAALGAHLGAGLRIELPDGGRLDIATLAVVVQCWLTVRARARTLVVATGDAADRSVLERLGFDEHYRVAEAA